MNRPNRKHPLAVDAALLIDAAVKLAAAGAAFVLVERLMSKSQRYGWLAAESELFRDRK